MISHTFVLIRSWKTKTLFILQLRTPGENLLVHIVNNAFYESLFHFL